MSRKDHIQEMLEHFEAGTARFVPPNFSWPEGKPDFVRSAWIGAYNGSKQSAVAIHQHVGVGRDWVILPMLNGGFLAASLGPQVFTGEAKTEGRALAIAMLKMLRDAA